MPEGLVIVVLLLAFGYILLVLEIFLPGGILGVIGFLTVIYGCYLAFGLGLIWGSAAVGLSLVVAAASIAAFLRTRMVRTLVLDDKPEYWKAPERTLSELVGREGKTVSALRPAGIAQIGDERLDVVADSEFLRSGVRIRVVEVEGNRVVVEAIEENESPGEEAQ